MNLLAIVERVGAYVGGAWCWITSTFISSLLSEETSSAPKKREMKEDAFFFQRVG